MPAQRQELIRNLGRSALGALAVGTAALVLGAVLVLPIAGRLVGLLAALPPGDAQLVAAGLLTLFPTGLAALVAAAAIGRFTDLPIAPVAGVGSALGSAGVLAVELASGGVELLGAGGASFAAGRGLGLVLAAIAAILVGRWARRLAAKADAEVEAERLRAEEERNRMLDASRALAERVDARREAPGAATVTAPVGRDPSPPATSATPADATRADATRADATRVDATRADATGADASGASAPGSAFSPRGTQSSGTGSGAA